MARRRTVLLITALAAGLAATAGAVLGRRRAAVRESRYPPAGRFVRTPAGVVHAVAAGSGTPVVLVHGADGVLLSFTHTLLDDLAEGHLAIAVDRPGHGYSERVPPDGGVLRGQMEAVRAAVLGLGAERPVLLGHSYGAALCLRWALDHPGEPRALVLVSPAVYPAWPSAMRAVFAAPCTPVGRALSEAVVPFGGPVLDWASRRAFAPDEMPEAYRDYTHAMSLRPRQFEALSEEYRWLLHDLGDISGRYGEVALPVQIVVGSEDLVVDPVGQAGRLAREVPGAELTVLPGVGHEVHWSSRETVLRAVARAEDRAR